MIDYISQLRTLKKRIAYLDAVRRESLADLQGEGEVDDEYEEGVVQLALNKARKEAETLVYHLKFNLGTSKVIKGKGWLRYAEQAALEEQVADAIEKQYQIAASLGEDQDGETSNDIAVSPLSLRE